MTPVEKARAGVHAVLSSYQEATTSDEREQIAKLVSCLTPTGALSLAEMGQQALETVRESGR